MMDEIVLNSKYGAAFSNGLTMFHHKTGLTLADFAEFLGVPTEVVSAWEMGTTIPTKSQVGTVAGLNDTDVPGLLALDESPEDLFVGYENSDGDGLVSDAPWIPDVGYSKAKRLSLDEFVRMKQERNIGWPGHQWGRAYDPKTHRGEDSGSRDENGGICDRSRILEKILGLYNSLDDEGREAVRLAVGERESEF